MQLTESFSNHAKSHTELCSIHKVLKPSPKAASHLGVRLTDLASR